MLWQETDVKTDFSVAKVNVLSLNHQSFTTGQKQNLHTNMSIKSIYNRNTRMFNLATAYVLSALVLRYPVLVSWLPTAQQTQVFNLADVVTQFAFGLALYWAQDRLKPATAGKGKDAGESKG